MNIYEIVTNKIIEQLQKGTVPWNYPWSRVGGRPKNLVTGKEYNGINIFLTAIQGYASPYWLTLKQANELGGSIKSGQKSTICIFWNWLNVENKDGVKEEIPYMRYYNIFNVAQTVGIKAPEPTDQLTDFKPIEEAERIVKGMRTPPTIEIGMDRAWYKPSNDTVGMPFHKQFKEEGDFYATLFHELTHSTGHESRLNRKAVAERGSHAFGSIEYSKEELVAEMGSAFLCAEAGIESVSVFERSAAYIDGWLQKLKGDSKLVIHAAAQAQKASDFILNRGKV